MNKLDQSGSRYGGRLLGGSALGADASGPHSGLTTPKYCGNLRYSVSLYLTEIDERVGKTGRSRLHLQYGR
jgi:hypothetical protein